jgi:hypothetical protein
LRRVKSGATGAVSLRCTTRKIGPMKTPNDKLIGLDAIGADDDDVDLRALISVDLEEDGETPPVQAVDEFSDEFLLQAPRSRSQA